MSDQSAAPWTLPRQPLCVNRVAEIGETSDAQVRALADGRPVLLQLAGARGIGKTTLALHLAYRFARDYPDGGLFLDAHGSDPRGLVPAADLARQLLAQLGTPSAEIPGAPEDRLAAARGALARKRILLVIDDVKMVEQLDGLLGDVSQAAVVVTSRSKLDALTVRHQFARFDLPAFDLGATAELIEALGGGSPEVPPEVINGLWRKCSGLPLALAVGGGLIVSGEDDPRDFVESFVLADLESDGDVSVSAVFDAIYLDLTEEEKRDYRLLGLAPGPDFGLPLAAAVLGGADREVRRRLARLVRKYLLEDRGAGRYRFHQLFREHAEGLAWEKAPDEAQDAVERATVWLAGRAVALDRGYAARPVPVGAEALYAAAEPAPGGMAAVAGEFGVEWESLVAGARGCADLGKPELAAIVPTALYSFAYQTRRSGALIDLYRRALDFAATAPVEWQLNRDLAGLHEQLGDGEEVLRFARAAADSGYGPGKASALEWLGLGNEQLSRFAEARTCLREALAAVPLMADPAQEERAAALLRMHSGRVAFKEGLLDEAVPEITRAGEYFAGQDKDTPNLARCEKLLGDIDRGKGDTRGAEAHWRTASALFERVAMPDSAAEVLEALAALAEAEGRASGH
ncbi:NB-ARC domain-containing protein [Amycolatopsis saalfeldensis]|uniref:NB-ARC domain-containing protein n=1 Tax=Amycolatopsis saalfeldensis TaxID=394193 RepID=A0A1H8VH73_9PSEU|nr:NB-ARC domain-containing protein [Amycolatopsis saalfeldensis]SEP14640.1 NB-ARC domain-containing protein [Amycolatopsis saalfeldensis]